MITLILKALLLLQFLNEISSQCTKPDHFCKIIHPELARKTVCKGRIYSCHTFGIYTKRDITCRDISLEFPLCNFEDKLFDEDSMYIYDGYGKDFFRPTTLTITNLKPTVIQQSIFKNIVDVQILDVSNSNIQKIVPGAFNFQARLQEINLYGNNLTTILDGTFCSLPQLKLLNLSFNAIGYIMDNSFHDTPLKFLYLSNNELKTLNYQIFKSLMNLQYLDISFNHIKEFTVDLSNTSIETIILNNNNIQSVEINSTMLGPNLREIYIEHNLITSIPVDAFSQLHKLEKLSLSENELTVIPNSVFKNNNLLNYLDLSMNKLREFSYGTFDNLEALTYLNISFNKFEKLLPQNFHALTNLSHFYIQGNKIQNINVHDLLKYLARLQDIGIDGNPWSCQNLIDFTHQLKLRNVQFVRGKTVAATTIYGLECSPENEIKFDSIQRDDTLLKENIEKMINTISQNFKTDQIEMAKNNKIITESFLNKLQQENEASNQLFESIMEKVSLKNTIEVFILIFLIAIMLLLTSAVYIIFNGYKRLDNTNVSEVELGQLLRNKSQNA